MASSLTKCWNFRYTENNVKTSTKLASSHFHCSTAILLSCTVTEYAYFQDAEKVHCTGKRCRFRRNAFSFGSNVNCHLMKMGTSLTKSISMKMILWKSSCYTVSCTHKRENLGRRVLPGNCKRVQQVHGRRRFGEDVASTVSDRSPK
ncbi:hypothetical protein T03_7534 [Trichinella britovi]|uniref:Uncharacterized protein n=1 Tax=Trichinella britovi TaxID=45882 RepID=A0A0V1CMX0_TRIBR|nr:hypothetical protein T03_7534 [Trichinella britovi]